MRWLVVFVKSFALGIEFYSPVDIGCQFGWQPYGLILLPLHYWKWNKRDWPPGEKRKKKKTGSMKWKQWAQSVGDWVWRCRVGIIKRAWSRRGAGTCFEHWSALEQDIEPPNVDGDCPAQLVHSDTFPSRIACAYSSGINKDFFFFYFFSPEGHGDVQVFLPSS